MGPTGSGKTSWVVVVEFRLQICFSPFSSLLFSLLDVLAQRKDPAGLKEGYVLMNGEKTPLDFRLMSGYVVQVILHCFQQLIPARLSNTSWHDKLKCVCCIVRRLAALYRPCIRAFQLSLCLHENIVFSGLLKVRTLLSQSVDYVCKICLQKHEIVVVVFGGIRSFRKTGTVLS